MDLKGNADTNKATYNVEAVVSWLRDASYRQVTIRTDGEPVLVALTDKVKAARGYETVLQRSPTRSSQSLGGAERAVRTIKEQLRTLRYQLETKACMKITPDMQRGCCRGMLSGRQAEQRTKKRSTPATPARSE